MVTPGVTNVERLEAAGRSSAEQRNVATVRAIFEAFARSDFTVLRTNLAASGTTWVIGLTPERLGERANDPSMVPNLFCNGMHFDIKQAGAEGDRVFVEWEDEALTSGGKIYRNTGVSIFRFDTAGKVESYHEYIDPANFFAVL